MHLLSNQPHRSKSMRDALMIARCQRSRSTDNILSHVVYRQACRYAAEFLVCGNQVKRVLMLDCACEATCQQFRTVDCLAHQRSKCYLAVGKSHTHRLGKRCLTVVVNQQHLFPCLVSAAPRLNVVVVFPVPPFAFVMHITSLIEAPHCYFRTNSYLFLQINL